MPEHLMAARTVQRGLALQLVALPFVRTLRRR
jgi:hypothetical protein